MLRGWGLCGLRVGGGVVGLRLGVRVVVGVSCVRKF